MIAKSGWGGGEACLVRSPPTMKVSVPASAPDVPPETGRVHRREARRLRIRRHRAGAVDIDGGAVEMQNRALAHRRDHLGRHARRIAPLGSMVITTSCPCGRRRGRNGHALDRDTGSVEARDLMPALARLAAIGAPILPSPMKPIFMGLLLPLKCQCAAWQRLQHLPSRPLAAAAPARAASWARGPCRSSRADAFEEIALFHRPR
jgi:hypothetical protein